MSSNSRTSAGPRRRESRYGGLGGSHRRGPSRTYLPGRCAFCVLALLMSCAVDRGGVGPCNPRVAGSCLEVGPDDGSAEAGLDAGVSAALDANSSMLDAGR